MDSTKPTKPELRQSLQQGRLALSAEDRQEKAKLIAEKLLEAVNWSINTKVHCFEPIMRLGEVDLVDFVVALQTDEANVQVFTSRKMDGKWQVVSADTDKPVVVPKFDVIVVPMLGFDPDTLQRIGYGGGYYDNFLSGQPQAKKIGVCYEVGKTKNLPTESHDIPLDMVVTELIIYRKR